MNESENKSIQILMEEYKIVIDTQMHFNEMLMKMRTTVFSVIIAVYGGAAALLGQYPKQFISIFEFQMHISAPVLIFGLFLLLAISIIDYSYYYKMLLGAVQRGYEFDKFFEDKEFYKGFMLFGMSTRIRASIGKKEMSKSLLIAFYSIIGAGGFIYLIMVLVSIKP